MSYWLRVPQSRVNPTAYLASRIIRSTDRFSQKLRDQLGQQGVTVAETFTVGSFSGQKTSVAPSVRQATPQPSEQLLKEQSGDTMLWTMLTLSALLIIALVTWLLVRYFCSGKGKAYRSLPKMDPDDPEEVPQPETWAGEQVEAKEAQQEAPPSPPLGMYAAVSGAWNPQGLLSSLSQQFPGQQSFYAQPPAMMPQGHVPMPLQTSYAMSPAPMGGHGLSPPPQPLAPQLQKQSLLSNFFTRQPLLSNEFLDMATSSVSLIN